MTTSLSRVIHCHLIHRHFSKLLFLLPLTIPLLMAGCLSNDAPPPPKTVVSTTMGTASLHETGICTTSTCEGSDCQTAGCHSPDDPQHGSFTVSGTVYQQDIVSAYTNTNATIEFYSDPGGNSANRIYTLPVDKYGNFYTTESIADAGDSVYLVLHDVDNNRRNYMPRSVSPIRPLQCNSCHGLSDPALAGTVKLYREASDTQDPGPAFLHINNGITSGAGTNPDYHLSGDPGPDCLQSGCHDGTGTGPLFSIAGAVIDSDSGNAYTLNDASIGLFPQACAHPPNCTYPSTDADGNPIIGLDRPLAPKLILDVDSKGNFYSTVPINWTSDFYPTLANYSIDSTNKNAILRRNVVHMGPTIANTGDCYSCHDGATTTPISIAGQ